MLVKHNYSMVLTNTDKVTTIGHTYFPVDMSEEDDEESDNEGASVQASVK